MTGIILNYTTIICVNDFLKKKKAHAVKRFSKFYMEDKKIEGPETMIWLQGFSSIFLVDELIQIITFDSFTLNPFNILINLVCRMCTVTTCN
uniref:Uncharacterized protein n=1 Tax=Pyxicephalus adspersus TaxID=30357 RepID=A0AAV3AP71_PYXAD|nr:TPA: hypothetical protein GDO54_008811 [Pyxicephalus adspersus]